MSDEATSGLPAGIANAITGVVHALIPSSVKALNRLIGAVVEIPAAHLERVSERTRAKTRSYVAVEDAVANAVAQGVVGDVEIARRAMNVLVAKEYRKQENREAVAKEFLNDLRQEQPDEEQSHPSESILDDDWLNVFERYAEDASTERMQALWGRVLAGEVRKPGRFSMRTLRFLSEFSQRDALLFAEVCDSTFGGIIPNALVKPNEFKDISGLLDLETAGLITGASGLGLTSNVKIGENGFGFVREDGLALQFKGVPGISFPIECCTLTPLGRELIFLLSSRDTLAVARRVAHSIKRDDIEAAFISRIDAQGRVYPIEVLWQPEAKS